MPRSVSYEFDEILPTCQGLPGSLAPGSPTADPADGTVLIGPARSLHYLLDTPLRDVVGLSCRLRIKYPAPTVSSSLRILQLGDAFDLGLEPLTTYRALVRVRLHQVRHDLGQLANPGTRFAELRLDWHTSGKTFLRVDGRLVGYHDTLGRGRRLTIEDVTFGAVAVLPDAPAQHYQLREFSVSALLARPRWPHRYRTVVHRP
ncbi:hypothetical protein [Kribbella sp. NPDC050459]|jgi:hypothetical protein|uniref:hypothetical protein n=1 Tax=Kribbella sp. NPDC050459 TaxID=3155785 RepID=UPI002FB151CA